MTASRFPASVRVIGRSIVDWWDSWIDNVVMILAWVLSIVTVVLAAPVTFGFYYAIHEMIEGSAMGIRGMWYGIRKFFWKSLLWGLVNVIAVGLLIINFVFYGAVEADWGRYVQGLVILTGLLWLSTQFYTIPFMIMYPDHPLGRSLKNGFFTTLAAPFFTIFLVIVVLLLLALSFGFFIPLFLGVPALVPIMGFRALYNRLEAFGLREREKTPQELEMEAAKGIDVSGLNWIPGQTAMGRAVPKREGKVEDQETN